MDTIEVYEMMNGMCEEEGVKELKLITYECQDTRDLFLEEERGIGDILS